MFGFNPTAAAPIAATDKIVYFVAGSYVGNPISVPSLTVYEDETFTAPYVQMGSVRVAPAAVVINRNLASGDITLGNPAIDATTIAQDHNVSGQYTGGAVSVGSTALTQNHDIAGDDVAASAPVIDTTDLTEDHKFTPRVVSTGSVSVDTTAITQHHYLDGSDVASSAPDVEDMRFEWMETYYANEPWTEQAPEADTWTEQSTTSETWTEAA
jgi:hypothetical protein